jgi:hypothetical protein
MSWTSARAALDARMASLPSLGASKIAWPNVALVAQSSLYYAVHFLPATVQPELHGADHESGIYQVSVFVPAGGGIGPAMTAAQAVADHFKRQNLSGISCGVPTLAPPIQEPDWWHVPVSIPFSCL